MPQASRRRSWGQRLVVLIPYLWLGVFFLAPFLLWTGGTLFLLRVTGRLLAGGRFATMLGGVFGPGGELAGRSLANAQSSVGYVVDVNLWFFERGRVIHRA